MKEQVYLCTRSHFHPVRDPYNPLCLVCMAQEGNYQMVTSKLYRSHNFVEMLTLAYKMDDERGIKLTVLSTNIEAEHIYQLDHYG